jgi:hypothetical protein
MTQMAAPRKQLYKYKGNKCANCGLSVEEMLARFGTFNRMFQFNHVDPKQKDPRYDNLIQRQLSGEQLDEVDKCVLLCNECHGILHAQPQRSTALAKARRMWTQACTPIPLWWPPSSVFSWVSAPSVKLTPPKTGTSSISYPTTQLSLIVRTTG